jgi:hypothetical protein
MPSNILPRIPYLLDINAGCAFKDLIACQSLVIPRRAQEAVPVPPLYFLSKYLVSIPLISQLEFCLPLASRT